MTDRDVGERLDATEALDRIADPLLETATRALPKGPVKDFLHGVWLGHPLHPLLTDLPIGFWTSAVVLDIVGGRRSRPAADTLVGLGVVTALPTAVSGLADWSELNHPERRTGVVHAAANVSATALYGLSFLARRRGRRVLGVALGLAGASAATVGGYLGGHLVYRRGSGANQGALAPAPDDWVDVGEALEFTPGHRAVVDLEGVPLVVVHYEDGVAVLADRCSHLGGPLHEGTIEDGCVRCPWHGSTFRLADGSVVHGPATAPQPSYESRTHEGRLQVRRRRS